MNNKQESKFLKLIKILKELRLPNGCDWDKKQTHDSLVPYLIEETYEVVEAIKNKDTEELKEELGDLLLHVVFQAELASEKGDFDIFDSLDSVNNKLMDRHPHIFKKDSKNINWEKGTWEQSKKKEKNRSSILDGVPRSLPSLLRSRRIQEKASSVGFDWKEVKPIFDKVKEELIEVQESINQEDNDKIMMEIGDLFFSVVNLSRFYNINPEDALNKSTDKFVDRFNKVEKNVSKNGKTLEDLDLATMDKLWNQVKLEEDN
tara:strand:- start:1203 stop:1985 length:783 start_codon:yes stop_codon:yes gene_type:complete